MRKKHCYEIDFLRILGAFSVLFYHYTFRTQEVDGIQTTLFPYIELFSRFGYLGVNLFFMISGFVILFSASNKTAINFAISRADRLYPTYWACVTISALTIYIFEASPPDLLRYLANLTMINDYLHIRNIDGVYWTLHAELKFYALIFLLIFARLINKPFYYLSIWLFFAFLFYFTHQPFFMGWFISPSYSSYFISGISFYWIYKNGLNKKVLFITCISFVLSILYGWRQVDDFIRSPTDMDRLVACFIIFLLYLIFLFFSKKQRITRKFTLVAKLSALTYSIYLIHTSVGKRFFDFVTIAFEIDKYITLIISIILIISLSILIHVYIEVLFSGKIKQCLDIFYRRVSITSQQ